MDIVCISDDSAPNSPSNGKERQGTIVKDDIVSVKQFIYGDSNCDVAFDQLFSSHNTGVVSRTDSGISSDTVFSKLTEHIDSDEALPTVTMNKVRSRVKRKSIGSMRDNVKKKRANVAEKEKKKQKMAEERAAKQNAAELNKVFKPGECIKYMIIELHPNLASSWLMSDLAREADACGARLSPASDICDPGLVMWSRILPRTLAVTDGQVELTPRTERCPHSMYVMTAEELAPVVSRHSLATHVSSVRDMAGCKTTLLVYGVKDYFKSQGTRKNQNTNKKLMTEIDMEMAFTDLLVSADCDTVLVNTPNELALVITQHTKAIAEEPYKKAKRACDDQADFYMRGGNKKCVAVDKDGHGVASVWQQMLAILPLSSLETSRAVCAKYKSPLALYEALQAANSVNDLADIGVSRAAVPGSKSRRLGPEFARKLRTLFTADDGDVVLE